MKKIILTLMAFLLLTTCALAEENQSPAAETDAIEITDNLSLDSKTIAEESTEKKYEINATYPQIAGENLTPSAERFNELMLDIVKTEIQQFKKYVQADLPHMKNLPDDVQHNNLDINYDAHVVHLNDQPIISIRLTTEGFQAGRAHPYHNFRVLNYDLTQANVLALDALFKPKSNYLKIISQYCNKKLHEKIKDDMGMIGQGSAAKAVNYKNWNLREEGILITFSEYQVAPYVYGAQEITVPFAVLKKIMISPEKES